MKKLLFLATAAALSLAACNKDQSTAPGNPNSPGNPAAPNGTEINIPDPDASASMSGYNFGSYDDSQPELNKTAKDIFFKHLPGTWPLIDYRIRFYNPDSSFKSENPTGYIHKEGLVVRPYKDDTVPDGYEGKLNFHFHTYNYWENIRYKLKVNAAGAYILMGSSQRPFKVVNLDSLNLKTQWWVFDTQKNHYIVYQHTFKR